MLPIACLILLLIPNRFATDFQLTPGFPNRLPIACLLLANCLPPVLYPAALTLLAAGALPGRPYQLLANVLNSPPLAARRDAALLLLSI